METVKYSVEADTDVVPLISHVGDYGSIKFLYDRWKNDPEVFEVVMYRHVDDSRVIVSEDELL